MAIAIKNIPALENRVAEDFVKKAHVAAQKKASVPFKKEATSARSILQKANLTK